MTTPFIAISFVLNFVFHDTLTRDALGLSGMHPERKARYYYVVHMREMSSLMEKKGVRPGRGMHFERGIPAALHNIPAEDRNSFFMWTLRA